MEAFHHGAISERERNVIVMKKYTYVYHKRQKRRWFLPFLLWFFGIILVVTVGLALTNQVINHQLMFISRRITVQKLPPELENWSILHISDLKGATFGENQREIRKLLENKAFSSVVFTGDMVGEDGDIEPFLQLVALLPTDVPKLMIPGDRDPLPTLSAASDSLSVYAPWVERLQAAGVTLLDEPMPIHRSGKTIWFVPEYMYALDLDSYEASWKLMLSNLPQDGAVLTADQGAQKRLGEYHLAVIERLRTLNKTMTPADIQIALTHMPLQSDYISTMLSWTEKSQGFTLRQAALILAGHYNAGGWRIPGVGAIYQEALGWFPEDADLMDVSYMGGVPQYISPGLSGDPPLPFLPGRFLNHPAITLITLTARMT